MTLRIPAEGDTWFAPGWLDGQVGASVTIRHGSGSVEGTVVAAEVVRDGTATDVTIDFPVAVFPGGAAGLGIEMDQPRRDAARDRWGHGE